MEERMRNALLERRKLTQKQVNELDMKCVLEGKDIPISFRNECGYHYEEKNWAECSESEKNDIRLWIRNNLTPITVINLKHTSYGLKHECEADLGFYVHNDAMKKAMLLEGYIARTGTINWCFNVSEKYWAREKKEKERKERKLCHINLKPKKYY